MDPHRPIRSILSEMNLLKRELAEHLAFDEALSLAIEERTGQPAPDGAEYTAADRERALEILELYPAPGKDAQ